ncbi:MAG: S-layer protein [Chloroflexi bacterium]|nr:S-layer protein [Chloroflexota bacterium]
MFLVVTGVFTPGLAAAGVSDCQALVAFDIPGVGGTARGSTLLAGWTLDPNATSGSGVTAVHIYRDGLAGGGGVGMGVATVGIARPDVDLAFGLSNARTGWQATLDFSGVSAGTHTLYIYAQTSCGWVVTTFDIVVGAGSSGPSLKMNVDVPSPNVNVASGQTLDVGGWSFDGDAGAAIESVAIYVDGQGSSGRFLANANLGGSRPDVAFVFGMTKAATSGFNVGLLISGLTNGSHTLYVTAKSSDGDTMTMNVPFTVSGASTGTTVQTTCPSGQFYTANGCQYSASASTSCQAGYVNAAGYGCVQGGTNACPVGSVSTAAFGCQPQGIGSASYAYGSGYCAPGATGYLGTGSYFGSGYNTGFNTGFNTNCGAGGYFGGSGGLCPAGYTYSASGQCVYSGIGGGGGVGLCQAGFAYTAGGCIYDPYGQYGGGGTAVAFVSSTGAVTLTWTASATAVSYRIYSSSGFSGFTSMVLLNTVPAPQTSVTLSGLTPNSTMYFQVRAVDASGLETVVSSSALGSVAVAAPSGFLVASKTSTTATLAWNAATAVGLTGYTVYQGATAAGPFTVSAVTPAPTAASTGTTVTGLTANTTYFFYVVALITGGASLPSTIISTTIPPAAPTMNAPTAGASPTINLSWTVVTGAATYNVYRSPTGVAGTFLAVGACTGIAATVCASSAGQVAATTYFFQVKAVGSGGEGDASNTVSLAAP